MLSEKYGNVKSWTAENKGDLFIAVSFLFVALISFGLGRLSFLLEQKSELTVDQLQMANTMNVLDTPGLFVASKNGKAYYLPSCSGVERIKEENKIWFSSKTEAESLGYRPAANCSGF